MCKSIVKKFGFAKFKTCWKSLLQLHIQLHCVPHLIMTAKTTSFMVRTIEGKVNGDFMLQFNLYGNDKQWRWSL